MGVFFVCKQKKMANGYTETGLNWQLLYKAPIERDKARETEGEKDVIKHS